MKEKTLHVLEYNKIIEMLREQAGSEMTKKVISEPVSYTHLDVYKRQSLHREGAGQTEAAQ